MWLPQGGALKTVDSQFTQYSIIMLARSYTQLSEEHRHRQTHRQTHTDTQSSGWFIISDCWLWQQYTVNSIIMILSSMVYLILNINH